MTAESGNLTVEKKVVRFVLDNFSHIFDKTQPGTFIFSPQFEITINHQITKWALKLYPKGKKKTSVKDMAVFLYYLSDYDCYIDASFSIIINDENETSNLKKFGRYHLFSKAFSSWGFPLFISQNELLEKKQELLPGNKLTIQCEVFLDMVEEYFKKIENGKVEEFEDFAMLFENPKLRDVTLLVNDYKLYGHKYVLAQKSSVFAATFKHEMLENGSNDQVNLKQISEIAAEAMLRFMYTDEIVARNDLKYVEILKAADVYAVEDLMEKCEEEMCNRLRIENVFEFLIASHDYDLEDLKASAVDFIIENLNDLIDKPEFESINTLKSEVVKDIFREITLQMEKLKASD